MDKAQPHYIRDRTCKDGKPCTGEIFDAKYGQKWRCSRCKEPFAGYIRTTDESEKPPKRRR